MDLQQVYPNPTGCRAPRAWWQTGARRLLPGLFYLALALAAAPGWAAVTRYYVKVGAAAGGDGASWTTAYQTIQAGVDAVETVGGGEVWVARGTYTATAAQVVDIPAGVSVYGGFAGTENALDKRNLSANKTIIDGQQTLQGVVNKGLLDGFVVQNGVTPGDGGGIYNTGTVSNCTVAGNSADYNGGGIYNDYGTVANCAVAGNSATRYDGGGIYNNYGTVANCAMAGNSATGDGGGICNYGTVTNCIIWHNTPSDGAGNQTKVSYSCFAEATGANHNLRANPRFVSLTGADPLAWDLRLQADSPCIDAGATSVQGITIPATDMIGNPRPGGDGKVDMGACESPAAWTPGAPAPVVLYVSPQGSGTSGRNWTEAFKTITNAMQAVQSGVDLYEIRVAAGTYREGREVVVGATIDKLSGGWSGNPARPAERDPAQYKTVVDGENKYCCLANRSLIDGLWVQHGSASYGGGIDNYGTVTNCTVTGNSATENGGGIYSYYGSTVTNCTVAGNSAGYYGGGIYNYGAVINCTVAGNAVTRYEGGGIFNRGTVTNCTVAGNSAGYYGGGIYNDSGILKNTICFNNTSDDMIGNQTKVSYCCFAGATADNHNLSADPRFVSFAGSDPLAWDLRLRPGSPCLGAGDPAAPSLPPTDLAGNPRPGGDGKVDLGAYETPTATQTGALKVTLAPVAAVTAGAQWRRAGTAAWLASGATETGIPAGTYTVEFKGVAGWRQPASARVTVNTGQTAQSTGTYQRMNAVAWEAWVNY